MIPGLFFFFGQITRSLVQKWYLNDVFHQIAIAIGVLTSNTRKANHFGGLDVALGCHCGVLWWAEGRMTTNFLRVDVLPLLGTIARCYGWGGG